MVDRRLNVLIIDYNQICLMILGKMLQSCDFMVTKSRRAKEALSMLQNDTNRFDIVMMELHMPDMDGFQLLQFIIAMDLPVIVTSSDEDEHVMRKVILEGASDFLVKPIRMEQIRHVWKYVYQAQRHGVIFINNNNNHPPLIMHNYDECCPNHNKYADDHGIIIMKNRDDRINISDNPLEANNGGISSTGGHIEDRNSPLISCNEEELNKVEKKRKECSDYEEEEKNQEQGHVAVNDDGSTTTTTTTSSNNTISSNMHARKKQRVIWTPELHDKFVAAVNHFGSSKAVPKKILEIMNVPGLTRENVASHLQKYRQYHKKLEQSLQQQKQSGNAVNLRSSQEQRRFQKISPSKISDRVLAAASFSSVQTPKVSAQPPHIVENTNPETKHHPSSNGQNDAYNDNKVGIDMPFPPGEVVNEVNYQTINYHQEHNYVPNSSCVTYSSTIDDYYNPRFHLSENPNYYCSPNNWVTGFAWDENNGGMQSNDLCMEIRSMGMGQPYVNGDVVSHARVETDMYGNIVDLGYYHDDPNYAATFYVEPFEQNGGYLIGRLHQENSGHTPGFGGIE